MAIAPLLTKEQLDALRQIDSSMVANAVETFNLRLRNTGFTDGSIRCMFPALFQWLVMPLRPVFGAVSLR